VAFENKAAAWDICLGFKCDQAPSQAMFCAKP
jgi:hypothetical protein